MFTTLIAALNQVNPQVWAIVLVGFGVVLALAGAAQAGSLLIGGGLTLLQHKSSDTP